MVRSNFTETERNGIVTLVFELPGIPKSDVKVKFSTQKITVAWQKTTVEDKSEGERLIRERIEKKYLRTIPIPPAVPVSLVSHTPSLFYLLNCCSSLIQSAQCSRTSG